MYSVWLLLFLLAVSLVILCLLVRRNSLLARKLRVDSVISEAVPAGYCYFDYASETQFISKNLLVMLGVGTTLKSWDELCEFAGVSDVRLHRSIAQAAKLDGKNFLHEIDVHLKQQGNKKNVQCFGSRVKDRKEKLVGLVIWFLDVTQFRGYIGCVEQESEYYKEEAKKFAKIMDHIHMPVWVRGRDRKIEYANKDYLNYANIPAGQDLDGFIPELSDNFSCALSNRLLAGEKKREHAVWLASASETRLFSISEEFSEAGGIYVGVANDITERYNVQRKLDLRLSAYMDLLQNLPSAVAIYGEDTRLKMYNASFVKLWDFNKGWLDDEPRYVDVLEFLRKEGKLPEQFDFRSFRKRQVSLFEGISGGYNEFFYLPDGRTLKVVAVPNAFGGVMFAYEDVTDYLMMERSYNSIVAVQKETLDNLNEGVIVFGQDGKIKLYNPMFSKIWPCSKEVILAKGSIGELLDSARHLFEHEKPWKEFRDGMIQRTFSGKTHKVRIERKDGKVLDRTSLTLPNGDILVSFVDITDSVLIERGLLEQNQTLQEVDRVKARLLANVSYEFRTPLTSILGFAQSLQKGIWGEMNGKQREYIDSICHSCDYLVSIVDNLLDLSCVEAGHITMNIEDVDLYEVVSNIVSDFAQDIESKNLNIAIDSVGGRPIVAADKKRIRQVFTNIFDNSVKFTCPDGKIHIFIQCCSDGKVRVSFQDNGFGIKAENLANIFDRFYVCQGTLDSKKTGLGLGLSVAKSFIELHGGSVSVESRENVGTVLKCEFEGVHAHKD